MGIDLKKEIKLSDLFKRGEKEPKAEKPPKEPKAPKEAGARASFLKRDVKLSLGRGRGEAKAEKQPEGPKQPKAPRGRGRKEAQPQAVPAIPLMRAFNLLPKEADQRQAKRKRPATAQLVLAVVGVVLIAALGSYFVLLNATVADKRSEHNELRDRLAALNVPAEEPAPGTEEDADPALIEERQARTGALATALGTRFAWDRLLREFSLVLPEDVWLKTIAAKSAAVAAADPTAVPVDPNAPAPVSTFEITGYTYDQEGVARLLARLSVLPELSSVQLVSSVRTQIADKEVVEFVITATVKPVTGASA